MWLLFLEGAGRSLGERMKMKFFLKQNSHIIKFGFMDYEMWLSLIKSRMNFKR